MELSIDTSGTYPIARISGEIRSEDTQTFIEDLHAIVTEKGAKLAIDLADVTWLDSTGLTSLINVVTRARLSEGRVILVAPAPFVAGIFEVTNLDNWFEIVEKHEEAAERFA